MKNITNILLVSLLFAAAALLNGTEEKTIQAKGIGKTYRQAVNEALITALEQHCGITMNAATHSQIASAEISDGNGNRVAINDAIVKSMQSWAKGRISGYQVISENYDSTEKLFSVELAVRIPGRYVVGLDPNARRRMAVAPFRTTSDSISVYGQSSSPKRWMESLENQLNTYLTQTRKFTMLDRKFDTEIQKELKRLSDGNAAPGETVRLNQQLGTDYLVLGTVQFHNVAAPSINPFTGQAVAPASALFAEITYRVILAPTGQLKWADTIRVDAARYSGMGIADFLSRTADDAAIQIADSLMVNILPLELVGKTASGQLVIGQGGKSLAAGEYLIVYAPGNEVKDTRTGEVLDITEDEIGLIQVVRVQEKISYAVVVKGDASRMKAGYRLRRPPQESQVPQEQSAPIPQTQVQNTKNGGVIVPF